MWLSEQQVQELTKRKRPSAQIRVLAESGIDFKVIANRPIVCASAIEKTDKRVRRLA